MNEGGEGLDGMDSMEQGGEKRMMEEEGEGEMDEARAGGDGWKNT